MKPIPESAWRDLVSPKPKPFRKGGRGPSHYDCAGVMEYVLHEAFGLPLPIAPNTNAITCAEVIEGSGPWGLVTYFEASRTPGAVILTREQSGYVHVWTVIDGERVITALVAQGARVMPTRMIARDVGSSIVGCYIHEGIPR